MLKLPGWYIFKDQKVYAYDAEKSDKPDVGVSHGFVHYGLSSKGKDRLGFAGVTYFEENSERA